MTASRAFLTGLLLAGPIAPCAPAHATENDAGAPIVVLGTAPRYAPGMAASATKTGTPLVDVPQSVTVLSRTQLDDQGFATLNDALRYVPGVTLGQGEGHRDQILLRGQATTADFFLDGLRDDAQYYRPLYNIEQVEVLKGANALLFGRGGGGGVVNRVSRQPQLARHFAGGTASLDRFGAWGLAADINQPLATGLAARIDATYEAIANDRDFVGGHFLGLAPTLAATPDDRTRLVLAYEYVEDRRLNDRGVPSYNHAPLAGYARTLFGDPRVNHAEVTAHLLRARLEQRFSDRLSLDLTGAFTRTDKAYANVLPGAASATTVVLTGYRSAVLRDNAIGQANLVWKTGDGAVRHSLLAGIEASWQVTDSTRADARFNGAASATVALARVLAIPAVSFTALTTSSHSEVRALSGYVQDQIEIGRFVQVIAGLRHDDFRIASLNLLNGYAAARSDRQWSPRLGVVLKPRPEISLYASYARSFLPQSGDQFSVLAASTAALAPERFRNIEAGVKWDLAPALALTGAVYQLDRTGTRLNDPANPGYYLTSGHSRVKGFEAALTGRVAPGWNVALGYANQTGHLLSAVASGTANIAAGQRLDRLPSDQLTAWLRRDVTSRLSLGLGLVHQASQFASISNDVVLPAFTRLDAALTWRANPRLELQANIENLTDTTWYASAQGDNAIAVGAPVNAKLTARVRL